MLNSVVWLKDDFRTINNPAISSLIDEKKDIIAKLITAHPTNSNSYHLQLDLFGLLNKTIKAPIYVPLMITNTIA